MTRIYVALFCFVLAQGKHHGGKGDVKDVCAKVCSCRANRSVVDCRDNRLTIVPNHLPHNTRELNLDWNRIGSLDSGVFTNVSSTLKQLSIRYNNIIYISDQAFSNLTHLRVISLEGNWLETLPNDAFLACASTLKELSLAYNYLDLRVVNASLSAFPKLHKLDLSGSNFAAGPHLPDYFANSTHLKELILRDVNFGDISADFFTPLSEAEQLRKLDMHNATITSVHPSAFTVFKNVNALNLSGSFLTLQSLQNIIAGFFNSSLSSLSLQGLRLTNVSTLPSGLLINLQFSDLKKLHLDGNHELFAGTIPPSFFQPLSSLHELHMEKCGLSNLPNGSFNGLASLKKLNLRHNLISCRYGYNCNGLLSETAFASLEQLDLSDNIISVETDDLRIEGEIFVNLQYLSLSNNSIEQVPKGLFPGLTSLQYLDLSFNPISFLQPHCFRSLHALQRLDIVGCSSLRHLHNGTFVGLRSLSKLHLHDNALDEVDKGALLGMVHLLELSLRHNRLTEATFSQVVAESPRLHYLDLGENLLDRPPKGLLQGARNLSRLLLEHNHISYCLGMPILQHLRVLNLSFNALSSPACFEHSFSSQLVVNLANNPFHCGCDTQPSALLLDQSHAIIEQRSAHLCGGSVGSYGGRSIFDASVSEWDCHVRSIVVPVVSALVAGFLGMLFGAVMVSISRGGCSSTSHKGDGDGSESSCECGDCGMGMDDIHRRQRRRRRPKKTKRKSALSIVSDECLIKEDDDEDEAPEEESPDDHEEPSDVDQYENHDINKIIDVIVSESNIDDLNNSETDRLTVTPGCFPV